ncbi:MAG: hypothetical protein HFF36_11715 [Coprobacillus sp.]|nr:hypothetical protein [Coprobacillus sp.]MCI9094432.1 hypothetical protein [Coprobacillus sp.]
MNMKILMKKLFVLDRERYENKHLKAFIRLEENIDNLDCIDSYIMYFIESIPKERNKIDFKYYFINFNSEYFHILYLNLLIMMLIIFPFAIDRYYYSIIVIPCIYFIISLVLNFILTIKEINALKRKLETVYKNIRAKL